jgi:FkbM family methyltransferase
MSFVSYAQNYEDVILWRALGDVERGFYVDVGAADPQEDSVTNAFYERGWSGINIEPVDEYFRKLTKARPRDTNINAAAGAEAGLRVLHTFAGTGLSTLDGETASRHQAAGRQACETIVPVLTLKAILEHCAPPTIHFLKIDVEGAEAEALKGLDLNAVRPWVIVIEGTAPNSQIITREEWEDLIVGCGYEFAYFDGLNCFYVAEEFAKLKEKLSVPPNFFDDFVRFPELAVRQQAANLEWDLQGQAAQTASLRDALQIAQQQTANLRNALHITQQQTANLRNALHITQEQTASLRNAVHIAPEQTASVRNALEAKQANNANLHAQNTNLHAQNTKLQAQNTNLQAQNKNLQARLDHLSGRIHQLEAQLAVPSVDRAVGRALRRARETGDRLTGGGLRKLARRALTALVRRSMRDRRVMALGRAVLRPFPKLATTLYQLATKEEAAPPATPSPPPATPSPPPAIPSPPPAPPSPAGTPPSKAVATVPATPTLARSTYLRLKAAMAASDPWNRIR